MDDPYAMIELLAWVLAILLWINVFMWLFYKDGEGDRKK